MKETEIKRCERGRERERERERERDGVGYSFIHFSHDTCGHYTTQS